MPPSFTFIQQMCILENIVLRLVGKIILAVGTKLQAIITWMALEFQERHSVVQGIPLVQVSDKQFSRSVCKADYLTLRHGFIAVHSAPGSKFNFQKYIKRSLEDDFKVVVGISPLLWATVVIFLLVNVNGWQSLFWASIPLVIILVVGIKLQAIITQMALEIQEKHSVVQWIPLVQVSDKNFWFSARPQLVLHFAMFQNAIQITYILWTWYEFGVRSCSHQNFKFAAVRLVLGVAAQLLCSYITLPLYALVTQMGSTAKKSIFDEQTSKAIEQWHMAAIKKKAERAGRSPTRSSIGGGP